MARTRYIKIGFFQNEQLAEFGPFHRLLFAGLWVIADSAGRLEDRPKRIKGELFPYDDLNVDEMLADLASGADPFVVRYEAGGKACIAIVKFNAHQRPHHREADSTIPGPPKTGGKTPSRGKVSVEPDLLTSQPALNGEWGMGNGELEMGNGEAAPAVLAPDEAETLGVAWNHATSAPIPSCKEITPKRRREVRARLKERPLAEWHEVIARIERSAFCRGNNDRGWVATFDWLLQPDTAVKVLEGKYDNRPTAQAGKVNGIPPAEIRTIARALGPGSWASECVNLHDGRCGGPKAHEERMRVSA